MTAVTFTLGADAVLDATAAAASAPLRPYRDAAEVSFCPGEPNPYPNPNPNPNPSPNPNPNPDKVASFR